MGTEGAPIELTAVCGGDIEVKAPDSALLLDVQVRDGAAVDLSPNAYTVEQVGEVDYTNGVMSFDRGGNLKVKGMGDEYEALADGFTLEVKFRTGEEIGQFMVICGNMHTGGYGLDLGNKKMGFRVHLDEYRGDRTAAVMPDTEYHVVGVYDKESVAFYINGKFFTKTDVRANDAMRVPTSEGARYLCIGGDSNSSGSGEHMMEGSISYVRIYEDALDDGEILYLYEQSK